MVLADNAGGLSSCDTATGLASCRSQELHLRPESHSYLPELGKADLEFMESKRPRLELMSDPLLRPSPLLATGQPCASEDLSKVGPAGGSRGTSTRAETWSRDEGWVRRTWSSRWCRWRGGVEAEAGAWD